MIQRSSRSSIYGGEHPAEMPVYTAAEAAHLLDLPPATVRSWCFGQTNARGEEKRQFKPVVSVADERRRTLSFRNLIELHVLAAIRRQHQVSLQNVRRAVSFMQRRLGVPHPLASQRMLTDGKDLLIERSGHLLNLSREGQLEMRKIVEAYLSRVVFGPEALPVRFFPFTTPRLEVAPRAVVIDPTIQFGRPCLVDSGIPTSIIAERFKAGEPLSEIAEDYGRSADDVAEALRFEIELAA